MIKGALRDKAVVTLKILNSALVLTYIVHHDPGEDFLILLFLFGKQNVSDIHVILLCPLSQFYSLLITYEQND